MSHAAARGFHNHAVPTPAPAQSSPTEGEARRGGLHLVERPPHPPSLTSREIQCLGWCAEGKSYWESGVILGIGERTVSFHMESVRSKLGAATNAHAVALAFKAGLLTS